jgi:hypothetical protein
LSQITISARDELTGGFHRYFVALPKREYHFFGFILESIEGLGYHRESKLKPGCMEVEVPSSLELDFLRLIETLNLHLS